MVVKTGTGLANPRCVKFMWTSLALLLVLATLPAESVWAASWPEPGPILGLPWGTPLEGIRQQFPGGELGEETAVARVYVTTSRLEGIPVIIVFQFIPDGGLQGVRIRFPAEHLEKMVGIFERQYGLAPARGNRQWKWEGRQVRISLGDYPHFRTRGWKGTAWLRTKTWEAALADADEQMILSRTRATTGAAVRASYQKRILNRIYSKLRYPATAPGIYEVSVRFGLTPGGHPMGVELTVHPPNRDVAESVRAAVNGAGPFPLPPMSEERHISVSLTVTIVR